MTGRADIHPGVQTNLWDRRDPMRVGFLGALGLHAALLGSLGISSWVAAHRDSFGSKDAGGMAVGIEVVNSIPLIHHGQTNPLTNDTESEVPQQPVTKPEERVKEEAPPPDSIRLKERKSKKAPEASERQHFRPISELQPNQLMSKSAPQMSSPMFTAMPGSGQIGAGKNDLEGTIFAEYGRQIQDIIARNWHTGDVSPQIRSASVVTADFDLLRDGSISHFKLSKSSNIITLDASVQRAIEDSKFPPLPAGFPRDHASVEFSFELKR
jgi:outer membrane biosynthesis protein TonB